jgi:hypothetical protein
MSTTESGGTARNTVVADTPLQIRTSMKDSSHKAIVAVRVNMLGPTAASTRENGKKTR